jgi:hypothetical protein
MDTTSEARSIIQPYLAGNGRDMSKNENRRGKDEQERKHAQSGGKKGRERPSGAPQRVYAFLHPRADMAALALAVMLCFCCEKNGGEGEQGEKKERRRAAGNPFDFIGNKEFLHCFLPDGSAAILAKTVKNRPHGVELKAVMLVKVNLYLLQILAA